VRTCAIPAHHASQLDLEHRAADTCRIRTGLWTGVIDPTLTESQKIQRKKIRPANQRQPDVIFHE
jgi:hypothetical protein